MRTRSHWASALVVVAIGLVIAVIARSTEDFSPHLFRIGVVLTLAGVLWYTAECVGVGLMRISAVVAAIGVVLALINIGDDKRIEAEAPQYLRLRESVGNELANVLPIGDAPGADRADVPVDAEAEDELPAEPTVEEAAVEAAEQQPTANGEGSIRSRDAGQVAAAAAALNRAVRTPDDLVATCRAVEVRSAGDGLGPLVVLEDPPAEAVEAQPVNLIADAEAAGEDDLSRFVQLLAATDLAPALSGPGPFTVFLPPAEDIDRLLAMRGTSADVLQSGDLADDRSLIELMAHHAVLGQLSIEALELRAGTAVPTLAGDELLVRIGDDGDVLVGGRTVMSTRITSANGVIHRISGLLDPDPDLMVVLADPTAALASEDGSGGDTGRSEFADLSQGLELTDLAADLAGQESFTIFAPDNEALGAVRDGQDLDSFFAGPAGRELLAHHIVPTALGPADLEAAIGTDVETFGGTTLEITAGDDGVARVAGADLAGEPLRATNGVIYPLDEVLAVPDTRGCEPREASVGLLLLLRDELIAARTRTSNASTQQQLSDRVGEVYAQVAELRQNVAVHELVIEGADTLVGDSLGFTVNDDVAARLGGWGWVVLAVALILGYRQLEIINGRREPGPIAVEPPPEEGLSPEAREHARAASVIIKNLLGQAELREPSSIPGGEATSRVAELLQDEGLPGGKAAQAVVRLLQNTAFPAKGLSVSATVERLRGPLPFRVTARVSSVRNQRLLYSQPFLAATLEEAARQAAAFVAVQALADSRTTLPWARWPDDDGTGLAAYQEVALDERTRAVHVRPVTRRTKLEQAVAACPHSGLARVALGQQLQLVGPLATPDDDVARDEQPDPLAPPDKQEIGRALVTGVPQFLWASTLYPDFLIGRYRLAATLSMLAEDVDELWHFEAAESAAEEHVLVHLRAEGVTTEIADVFSLPTRHRREWWRFPVQARRGRIHSAATGVRDGVRVTVRVVRRKLPFTSNVEQRVKADDAISLRVGTPAVETERSGPPAGRRSRLGGPDPDLLLELAAREVRSGLFALRWYPLLRSWRQAERAYWLDLFVRPERRRSQAAAFQILGEIVDLRADTVDGEQMPISPRIWNAAAWLRRRSGRTNRSSQ